MGQFRIEIVGVGGHGCDRTAGEGEPLLHRCMRLDCPDCLAADFVEYLKRKQVASVERATLTHWPGTPQEVQDDLVTNTRSKGRF